MIGSAVFAHVTADNPYSLYFTTDALPQNCPFPWGDLDCHLIHVSLGPSEPTTQSASQSVQPFCRWPHSVPMLYNCTPLPLKIAHSHGGSGPHLTHDYLGPSEPKTQTASVFSFFMAAQCNRAGHYIFALWFFLSFFFFLFFPRLISAVADWMSTILLHMVWP